MIQKEPWIGNSEVWLKLQFAEAQNLGTEWDKSLSSA